MKRICIVAAAFMLLACTASAQKTVKLFNGKNLSGWGFVVVDNALPASEVFRVKDKVIDIKGTPFGYMYTEEQYGDYILHVEWRWTEGESNSGIFLLMENLSSPFPKCIECQLRAGDAGDFIRANGAEMTAYAPESNRAAPLKKKNDSSEKPAGEWNSADIAVKDGVITVYINGVYQNTGVAKARKGHIGLQSEGKGIQFRNVTLTAW